MSSHVEKLYQLCPPPPWTLIHPNPRLEFEQFLPVKQFEMASQSMGTGSCHLLNAPENTQASLQKP